MNFEILPTYDADNKIVNSGIVLPLPKFCNKKLRKKCILFYESIKNSEGFHICPYGFTSYVHKEGQIYILYTGLRVYDYYSKKLTTPKIESKYNHPILKVDDAMKYINDSIRVTNYFLKIETDYNALKKQVESLDSTNNENIKFISDTLHEIRKLNTETKAQSEDCIRRISLGSYDDLLYTIQNIFNSTSLISIRLNSYDLLVNPSSIENTIKKDMGVFSKFEKITHCLKSRAKNKRIKFELKGNSFKIIDAYEIFEILPYLLYDNAIKYSPENQRIVTEFIEDQSQIIVIIESMGPRVFEEEIGRISEKDFRGENANKHNGTGIGLFLAKQICELHNIDIDFESKRSNNVVFNGIEYGTFRVRLRIPA